MRNVMPGLCRWWVGTDGSLRLSSQFHGYSAFFFGFLDPALDGTLMWYHWANKVKTQFKVTNVGAGGAEWVRKLREASSRQKKPH